jgi:endoglucanase
VKSRVHHHDPVRPRVRVNQLGYLPDAPQQATLVTDAVEPVEFTVGDWRGWSRPWPRRPEPTSGLNVHVLDFTAACAHGDDVRIAAGDARSHPFRVAPDVYRGLAADALAFFRRMRCEHPDTAVAAWTGPDAERLYPGWHPTGTFDVSGGWYDAGDYGKYVVSGSLPAWQLLDVDPRECRWQLDWLLRMLVPDGQPLAGMAFHRVHGTEWSPLPGLPHEDPTTRVLHRPSTAATLHVAAVAAAAARKFAGTPYAARLLAAARRAHAAAHRNPRLIAPDDEGRFGGGPYGDDRLADDFCWAAAELWLATGERAFLAELRASDEQVFDLSGFDFDRVAAPARIDLALVPSALPDRDRVRASVVAAGERLLALQADQPWGQPYAPSAGWDWGSNGRILNNLVVLVAAHAISGEQRFRDGVAVGMDYLLGRNALGQSYVTGYGTDATRHLRTRQFGDHPPPGALAGGANSRETPGWPTDPRLVGRPPQCCYLDEPTSETTNDVCIRWNAPLAFVARYLGPS